MKNKTANGLLKIIKYLVSRDEEIVLVGIALFKNSFIIQNIPKNKKFVLANEWKVPPPEGYSKRYGHSDHSFTKAGFIRMLDSQTLSYRVKVMYIFNLLQQITLGEHFPKRYRNYKLYFDVIYNLDNIPKEITSEKQYRHQYYTKKDFYLRMQRDALLSKKDTRCTEFLMELHDFGIRIDSIPYSSINALIRYCKKEIIGKQYLNSHQKYEYLRFLKNLDLDYLYPENLNSFFTNRNPDYLKIFNH